MKLKGSIKGVPILILVDSGAPHNFISRRLVTVLGLLIEETRPMRIKMGDGYRNIAQGICNGVELELGTINFPVDSFLFDLAGIDVVLGISWLASLCCMWVDWSK